MVSPTQLESRMREIRQSGSEGGEVMSLLDPYQCAATPAGVEKHKVVRFRWSSARCACDTPATFYDPCGIKLQAEGNQF